MNCPTCDVRLDRAEYESVSVSQCPQCMGYLVNRNRVILIKTKQDHSPETLQAEVAAQSRPDAQANIRCPKCRGRQMSKERVPVGTDNDFFLDVCRHCNVIWFDGGELARLQIQHESSTKALEAYAFQQKTRNRTEEQEE
ncbi:MAG: zf-TFIIB domain-containing protein, partial [Planctomycetes bacterium]|nr:zf-TFIIB domain-containing protein [Planctomycetota bacterium]